MPDKKRLVFVLLVAGPMVLLSTLLRMVFLEQAAFSLYEYASVCLVNFSMIYPLALIFVPLAQRLTRNMA